MLTQAGIFSPSGPAESSSTATSAKPTSRSASPTSTSASPTASSASPTPTQSTPETINLIPDAYLGQPYNTVRSQLVGMGLTVKGDPVFSDKPEGTVTNIEPSGPVAPGETITVTYSKGQEPAPESSVPAIGVGSSESQTQKAIEDAGLRWVKGADVPGSAGQKAGTFVSSEPGAGSKVPAGSVVTYHLAQELLPTPTTSTSN
jgi:serine/threonine-protein kinase